MENLSRLGKPLLRRASTYDVTGGNNDRCIVAPGGSACLEVAGAGVIRHIWTTMRSDDPGHLSAARLRMSWDDEPRPSVDVPFGDFFCFGHGEAGDLVSAVMVVSKAPQAQYPPGQAAFNCYFPMPFAQAARVEVVNGAGAELIVYMHLDYEVREPADLLDEGRFCATYEFERTIPASQEQRNTTGDENYTILDVQGEGHYVGCSLSVRSDPSDPGKWWEGDDMIFVDGEHWPPAIHGTGTEDYFNNAWGYRREFNTPYYGCSYLRKRDGDHFFNGLFTVYRFHILDPIAFRKSLRVTLEHGHNNDAGNAYSSVAYWYRGRSAGV